jgi:glucose/arabinose dehydrogenase
MMTQIRKRGVLLAAIVVALILAVLNWNTLRQGWYLVSGTSIDLAPAQATSAVLPAGFRATIFARDLQGPRFMAVGPDGTVYVAEQGGGRVSALPDADHNGQADSRITVADGLDGPSSVAVLSGTLLVGEHTRVSQLTLGADHQATKRTAFIPNLPNDGVHNTKTVLVGPDNLLYLAMGSTCNVCQESNPIRAAVSVYNLDGTGGRVFAHGLRNAVGLAVNPWTHAVWATNNGRDLLGDDVPPETLYALADGADYGWPRCHAGTIVDPEFGGATGCQGVAPPLVTFQAHMAPLGLAFYGTGSWPAPYNNSLYIAFHGSWNRSSKVGYKVMRVPLRDGQVAGAPEDFMTGFLGADGGATGRPAGVRVAPDGSLLVSADTAGYSYRVTAPGQP